MNGIKKIIMAACLFTTGCLQAGQLSSEEFNTHVEALIEKIRAENTQTGMSVRSFTDYDYCTEAATLYEKGMDRDLNASDLLRTKCIREAIKKNYVTMNDPRDRGVLVELIMQGRIKDGRTLVGAGFNPNDTKKVDPENANQELKDVMDEDSNVTALTAASYSQDFGLIYDLLNKGSIPTEHCIEIARKSAQVKKKNSLYNFLSIAKVLLNAQQTPQEMKDKYKYWLINALIDEDLDEAKELIRAGFDVNITKKLTAQEQNNPDLKKLCDTEGNITTLAAAAKCSTRQNNLVELILKNAYKVDQERDITALAVAAKYQEGSSGMIDLQKMFLKTEADVIDSLLGAGLTPDVHCIEVCKDLQIKERLLEKASQETQELILEAEDQIRFKPKRKKAAGKVEMRSEEAERFVGDVATVQDGLKELEIKIEQVQKKNDQKADEYIAKLKNSDNPSKKRDKVDQKAHNQTNIDQQIPKQSASWLSLKKTMIGVAGFTAAVYLVKWLHTKWKMHQARVA